nr:ribose-5-phosphate isomerase RpiA [uncultured Eisenbergiella sp.]
MDNRERQKEAAAKAAAAILRDEMTVGLGTGSTAYYFIQEAGAMVRAGGRLWAVVTSEATGKLAAAFHIPVISPEEAQTVDLAVDGVDAVDTDFRAVKGGGGALLREKIVAWKAKQVIWIMDESKPVKSLAGITLPVEVLPYAAAWAGAAVRELGGNAVCRQRDGKSFFTDNGNMILDVVFPKDRDPGMAAEAVRQIPGVLETGFFDRMCSRVLIGTGGGVRELVNPYKEKIPLQG